VAQGTAGPLESTVPPISAAAWVTFLTGQNPGRHGVYQFRKFDLAQYGGYRDEFATSNDYLGRSILELVSRSGLRVGAVGVPMTYPPFPVNGFLVSGFPRPFGPKAHVYPPQMAGELGAWDEMPDNFNFTLSPSATLEAADFWVRKYTDIALDALRREAFDLFLIVWNSTDNIPHLYWKYADKAFPAYDPAGAEQFGDVINRQYALVDREIGRLISALPDPDRTVVLVMSDHGMGPFPHRQVHLNAWLAMQGLLSCRADMAGSSSVLNRTVRSVRQRLPTQWRHRLRDRLPAQIRSQLYVRHMNLSAVDWYHTQAYRLKVFPTVEGIVINLRGRQTQGIVDPGDDYEALKDRLLTSLAELRDPETGGRICERASRREDLYEGPYLDDIPDILVELADPYTGGSALQGSLVTPMPLEELSAYSASHRSEGMFVLKGPGVRIGTWLEGVHIGDLAPTLLHLLGLPVSTAMDGQVRRELLLSNGEHPVIYGDYAEAPEAPGVALSVDDKEAIRQQLAGLGYLGD
jgi:predicted AlkP superfamily phosphohydrolase/phosphomutase